MNEKDSLLAELHQERMCDLCESHILGCSSMSQFFMCEGSKCHVAIEYLKDALEEDRIEDNKRLMYVVIR